MLQWDLVVVPEGVDMFWVIWAACVAISVTVIVIYVRREYRDLLKHSGAEKASFRKPRVRLSQVPLDDCPAAVIAEVAAKLPPPSRRLAD